MTTTGIHQAVGDAALVSGAIKQAYKQNRSNSNVYVESNNLNIQKQLVIQGFGYPVLPLVSVINEFRVGLIKVTPIVDPAFLV